MDDTQPPEAAPGGRRLGSAAATAVLVAVLLGAGRWVTHPERLGPVGSEVGVRGAVGQPVIVGLFAYPSDGNVRMRNAAPRVAAGSAAADVRVMYCVAPRDGSPIGALRATVEEACVDSPPLSGQRLTRPRPETRFAHLVVEIIPREAGVVTVNGADVAYSAGLQRGTQASGVVATVNAAA